MADILKVTVNLKGWTGGPGTNTWFGRTLTGDDWEAVEVTEFQTSIMAVYNAVKAFFYTGMSASIEGESYALDEATGDTVGAFVPQVGTVITGTATSTNWDVPRSMQANVRLVTDTIIDGHFIRGRHFLGPLTGNAIDSTGQLTSATRTAIDNAYGGATDLIGSRLCIYSAPKDARPGKAGIVKLVQTRALPGYLKSRAI